jgi:hypothetical protein
MEHSVTAPPESPRASKASGAELLPHRSNITESTLDAGLRLLLRYRVPESEVESTFQRIIEAVAARTTDSVTDLELAQQVRITMDAIAPRPREPIPRGLSRPSPELLSILMQHAGREKEILSRRYEGGPTIEEIAVSLQVSDYHVQDVVRRARRQIFDEISSEPSGASPKLKVRRAGGSP